MVWQTLQLHLQLWYCYRSEISIFYTGHVRTALTAMDTDVMLRETKQRADEHTNTTDIYCVEKIGCRFCCCCSEEDLQGSCKGVPNVNIENTCQKKVSVHQATSPARNAN